MGEPGQEDGRTAARRARADLYFKEHLRGQREWYSARSSRYRLRAQWLSLAIIVAGGLITFFQVFQGEQCKILGVAWPALVTALLALGIVAAEGVARIWRYQETWVAYRKASEEMKREYRLYINGAGAYEQIADEDAAYRAFVAGIEQVIAEEQQLYWRYAGESGGKPKDQPPG